MACKDDDFDASGDISLEFSVDTLRLDTVFTERGSATYSFKIYNKNKNAVKISSIELLNESGFFRLNVDGIAGNTITDIPVWGEDSVYVFCEVTIDPDAPLSVSPFFIRDKIRFTTNGNEQIVHLEAWGQNANYFPERANAGRIVQLTCNNGELLWNDTKPYVIYGAILIDSCLLRISEGTQIYVHGGIVDNSFGIYNDGLIFTLPNGKIIIEGSQENPVIIQGDRLEPAFEFVAGQWAGLRIGPLSRGNLIQHTTIKNSIVGIQVDSLAQLELNNVEIGNTSASGLVGIHSSINATNSLIHTNGGNAVQLLHGGNIDLNYCTLSSFNNQYAALSADNYYCYDPPFCDVVSINKLKLAVTNSILVGNDRDEIVLADVTGEDRSDFDYSFSNSIIKIDELDDEDQFPDFVERRISCLDYEISQALFADRINWDFHLDTLSIAEQMAKPIIGVLFDKDGVIRDPVNPDIGCYEYISP
jgi:hypothetical protein